MDDKCPCMLHLSTKEVLVMNQEENQLDKVIEMLSHLIIKHIRKSKGDEKSC